MKCLSLYLVDILSVFGHSADGSDTASKSRCTIDSQSAWSLGHSLRPYHLRRAGCPTSMKNGRSLKGHKRVCVKLGTTPEGYKRPPSGGYNIGCKCGWEGGNFTRRKLAHLAYREHIDDVIDNGIFKCSRCGNKKPGSEMRLDHRFMCLICFSQKGNEWAYANPMRSRAHKRKYWLMKKFGMTMADYDAVVQSQLGLCAICGGTLSDPRGFYPHIDHDHATGKFRGVLCFSCNGGLGNFKDSPEVMRAAADYIEKSKQEVVL